jgi:hypothetical protein
VSLGVLLVTSTPGRISSMRVSCTEAEGGCSPSSICLWYKRDISCKVFQRISASCGYQHSEREKVCV